MKFFARSTLVLSALCLCVSGPVRAARSDAIAVDMPKPLGNAGEWIVSQDYPFEALRTGAHGITSVIMEIDEEGGVAACSIADSSGSELLDSTACQLLKARARYAPARDRHHQPISATITQHVRWTLPEGADAVAQIPPLRPFSILVEFDVNTRGEIEDCKALAMTGKTSSEGFDPCPTIEGHKIAADPASDLGIGQARHVVFRMSTTIEPITNRAAPAPKAVPAAKPAEPPAQDPAQDKGKQTPLPPAGGKPTPRDEWRTLPG